MSDTDEGIKWNGMLIQKQEKTKKSICRQGRIRFNSGELINVGQRIQILLKTPKIFWNDGNVNNKPEQIIVYHNQWLYGFNFVRYQIKLINAIKFLIKEDENTTKNNFSSKYLIDYNRIIENAIKYANNSDLERMTNSNLYFDESEENNNKELEDSKSAVEFRDSFDNNNGYMFLQINKDGTIDFDILNGYEDGDEIIQLTAKEYISLFYSEEKLNPTAKKERDNRVKKLEKHAILDPAKVMCVEAKSKESKALLYAFVNKDEMQYSPDLDYHIQSEVVKCKYSGTYMLLAVSLLEASSECEGGSDSIIISVKKEYPITLENEHFKIVIAPIIGQSPHD